MDSALDTSNLGMTRSPPNGVQGLLTLMCRLQTNQNYWSRLSDVEQRLAELERRAGLAPLVEDDGGDSDDEMDDSDESDAEPEENMAAADDLDDSDDPGVPPCTMLAEPYFEVNAHLTT